MKTGRQLATHYGRLQDEVLAKPWALMVVSTDRLPQMKSAIRSAALQLSAASLTRRSLQRAAIWCDIPAAVALTAAVPFMTASPALPGITYAAVATICGALMGVGTLVVAATLGRAGTHFALMVALAVLGVAIEFPSARIDPAVVHAFTAFCVTPAAVYAAFLPMIAVAYGCAWRLIRTIDPRARLVIDLLHSVHLVSRDARWLHDARARDQVAMQIERAARVAERDLPRLLAHRIQDPGTSSWMRERSQLMGARIRECKRSLVLPDGESLDLIRTELLRLLLHATSSEWDAMCAQQSPPSRLHGLLRKYAPHVITGALLVVAGLALPEFIPVLKGTAGANLRTVLILSGLVALVPLDGGGLNRIPDAFAGAVNAK
jgi:hypothetical protein